MTIISAVVGCLIGLIVGYLRGRQVGILETEERWSEAVARKEANRAFEETSR